MKMVSEILGHSTIQFTMDVYGHVVEEMRDQQQRPLNRLPVPSGIIPNLQCSRRTIRPLPLQPKALLFKRFGDAACGLAIVKDRRDLKL